MNLRKFHRSLPMSLLKAREAVMRKFSPSLKEHNLSAQQWRVIRILVESDKLEITELAEKCHLLMPSISRIIQNLEKRQLIQREAVPGDQRSSAIVITPQGKKLFELIAPISEERYQYITERFGYGKLELLYELLDELINKLETEDETPK